MPMGDYDSEFQYGSTEDPFLTQMRQQYQPQPVGQPSQGPIIDFPQPPGGFAGNNVPAPPAAGSAPPSSSSSGSPAPGDPVAFIRSWQAAHQANEGIAPLAAAYKAAGFGDRFMYGNTPSNNELTVNGQKYKVIGGEDSPASAYWYTGGDDSAPGGAGGGGGFSAFSGGPGMDFSGGDELFSMLMDRAKQGTDVDPNDPIIRRNVDAFGAEQQRAERNYESKLAERVGEHANIGAERRMGAERVGTATSEFMGQMMNQERQAKRVEIQAALDGARGYLTARQSMQLQQQLHQMDLEENSRQFGANLGQRAYEFDTNDQYRYSPFASGG